MDIVRHNGKWFKIHPKPYEPEHQTVRVAWGMIQDLNVTREEVYKKYYENQRKEAKVLYPSFRKDVE